MNALRSGPGLLVGLAVATTFAIGACNGGRGDDGDVPAGPSPATIGTTEPAAGAGQVFDSTLVHDIRLEVSARDLAKLAPGEDERVHARLTFDKMVLDDVALRLKSGMASQQPLTGKPGFSIDTDRFDKDLDLFGVTRFTLGNAINDPSFVAEAISYEVFRSAGVVAPRTALAKVSLNGELLGLYVMREGYDKNFLARTFPKPEGNLYEAALEVDISNVSGMEARTNEAKDDKSDLEALASVVSETPDETFLATIATHVDIEQLLIYWAAEAIVHHWDGYIRPNNYYVYGDPATNRFVFLAHGADWTMLDPGYSVLASPGPSATMAVRLYADPAFRERLRLRILDVLDRAWKPDELLLEADRLAALVRTTGLAGKHETISIATFESELAARKQFIAARALAVRAQLAAE